jgi:hypothetical protein
MPDSKTDISVVAAVAAAVVTAASMPAHATVQHDQKFVVHPHVTQVNPNDRLLLGYLRSIYSDRPALQAAYPSFSAFSHLQTKQQLRAATQEIATALAVEMSKKNANPGILFGFILKRSDGSKPHGVIKADLDQEERFHMVVDPSGQWTWDSVRELLPPPKTQFAKFAIAPQPGGVGPTGIRDITDNEAAAAYFLAALGLVVPKTTGTQARVAAIALKAGYSLDAIDTAFKTISADTPVADFVEDHFPDVQPRERDRLVGRPERPMPNITAQDHYLRIFKTRSPRFELVVDETVGVDIRGRTITVTLPPGDQIERGVR